MADFYGSLLGADAYHAARANTGWAGDDAHKQAALLRASVYIDGRYRKRYPSGRWASLFPGEKALGRAQAREWPRTDAQDYTGAAISATEVPAEVEQAVYEAALRELVTPGSLSPDFVATSLIKSEKLGPLETTFAVPDASAPGAAPTRPVITLIDEIIAPVLVARYELPAMVVV
ncbi:DnaT-like ssDNA-binding protein [Pseudomonas oryzihabitans]|uniref:DnaT-like ssDNA-binding protein n=1 Tax=Pseudomonas oryzihabitans TaxID=47885 RepID=UPI002899D095|nr:DnaT-like ssDNA-binding protein [Pseudomonas oryzihabitans]